MKSIFFPSLNAKFARTTLLTVVFFTGWKACVTLAAPPVISNVTASQRAGTKLVDITYNLSDADGDLQNVQVQVSGDAGLTYTIPATALSGAVGGGVVPGNGRSIVWNAGVDWNGQYVPLAKVRVTAHDGTTPAPPPGFVYIPAGVFQMGDNLDGMANAMPVHAVQVDGFFLERFECSKELWQSVQSWAVGNGYTDLPAGIYSGVGHPVQSITWYAVVKWCNARSQKEGRTPIYYTDDAQTTVYRTGSLDLTNSKVKWSASGYRLPTEAEWEKAARGGALGQRYPWGDTVNGSHANYNGSGSPFGGNTSPVGYYNGSQVPVGVDMANGYGLYDMGGNIWEWCWDRFDGTYYSDPAAGTNPRGPDTGTSRLSRGGAWSHTETSLRCSNRRSYGPVSLFDYVGFRCARGL